MPGCVRCSTSSPAAARCCGESGSCPIPRRRLPGWSGSTNTPCARATYTARSWSTWRPADRSTCYPTGKPTRSRPGCRTAPVSRSSAATVPRSMPRPPPPAPRMRCRSQTAGISGTTWSKPSSGASPATPHASVPPQVRPVSRRLPTPTRTPRSNTNRTRPGRPDTGSPTASAPPTPPCTNCSPPVTASAPSPGNSEVVEGHVNRLKMIKRQMYGRAGFQLLRKRVLLS